MRHAVLLLVVLASAALASPHAKPFNITFQFFYRQSVSHPHTAQAEFTLSGAGQQFTRKTADVGEFRVTAMLGDDAHESRTVSVTVATKAGRQVSHQLFQLENHGLPSGEFAGGHGFSGLNYINHPATDAELQYIVSVAPSKR